ncbi:MAG: MBL fold metallo-hydrolase [Candidatus Aminicenantes bacterium]|nr:MAG: MBL fold metallo-hydrolase [Candidatus Aminicenantes bacterium]
MRQKGKLILILIFSCLIISAFSFAQQRETPPVKLDKISDRLFQILGGRGANGGVYIGDDSVLVIDAKMDEESVKQTIAEIKKVTNLPIKFLVNTHSDGDHIAGNRFFPESVTIVAHEKCREEFFHPRRDGKPSDWNNPELAPFVPSLTYHQKMDIYLGARKVELWYFGVGHTKGDTVVYFPEEKTAFLGDQIFMGRPQLIHSYKGGNSFGHVKALTKMLETLDAERFCSGHSDPIDRGTVKHHIEEMKKIQSTIKSLVGQGKSKPTLKQQHTHM